MKLAQRVLAEEREAKRRNSEAINAKEKRSSTKRMDSLRESSEEQTAAKSKMGEQESKSRETKSKNNRSESTDVPIDETSNATNIIGSIKSKDRNNTNNNNANIDKNCLENIRHNGFKKRKDQIRKQQRQGEVTDSTRQWKDGVYNSNNN